MSQASRYNATRAKRERERVARAIVENVDRWSPIDEDYVGGDDGLLAWAFSLAMEGRLHFDVHAARDHAHRLINFGRWHRQASLSPADALEHPIAGVYLDWAQANPGKPWPHLTGQDAQYVRLGQSILDMLDGREGTAWEHAKRQASECQACGGLRIDVDRASREIRSRNLTPFEVENLAATSKDGNLWSALEAQSVLAKIASRAICETCNGTGHNLSGNLPVLDPTPQVRRRRADQGISRFVGRTTRETWLDTDLGEWRPGWGIFRVRSYAGPRTHTTEQLDTGENGATDRTRTHYRGHHRDPGVYSSPAFLVTLPEDQRPDIDERITSRTMHHEHLDGLGPAHMTGRLPRWRSGERKHEAQRRSRELGGPIMGVREAVDAALGRRPVSSVEA